MDFSKLNTEFSNMQKTVYRYTTIISLINIRIKDNVKSIAKLETKEKNEKNNLVKDLIHTYITSLKCENEFLENLLLENNSTKKQ